MQQGEAGSGTGSGTDLNYVPGQLRAGIFSAELATVVTSGGSETLVAVTAQVAWYAPRTATEHIHADWYRSVTITGPSGSGIGTETGDPDSYPVDMHRRNECSRCSN
jgi:hypothetical protein